MYKISKYLVDVDLQNEERLIFSTRTGELINISNELYHFIIEKKFNKLNDITLLKLLNLKILIPEDENETDTIINNLILSSNKKSRVLSLTIQPTANCQLGCQYCGQTHEKLNMSESLVENTYKYIKNKLENGIYESLIITWYGAEPLLGLNSIKILSKKLIILCNKINIEYSAMMITNGLGLKENIFAELVQYKILKYQITLDGDKVSHDNSRYTKKKGKTFDTIVSNIVMVVSNPLYDE